MNPGTRSFSTEWWRRSAAGVLVVLAAACEAAEPPTTASGMPADTIAAQPTFLIGEIDGPPEYLFGDIASVVVGPGGVIYVADAIGSTVRAFDQNGSYLTTLGSEGDGPSDFRFPSDLAFGSDGLLYIGQRNRVSVFGASAESGAVRDSVIRTLPLGRARLETARAKVIDGRYYSPTYFYFMFVQRHYLYEVVDVTGPTGDTIPVPALPRPEVLSRATHAIGDGSARRPVPGLSRAPFEPAPSWDLTPEAGVLMALGDAYAVYEVGETGDTTWVIDIESDPETPTAVEERDSATAFVARLDSLPVPLSQMLGLSDYATRREVPETLPSVVGLQVTSGGEIWVTRWPSAGSVFDVFDREGRPLRTVRLPAALATDVPPYFSESAIVGVVRDPLTGIEKVAGFTAR